MTEPRIWFKDKSDVLKGPFKEREVQEWYRKKWFDNSVPFYFSRTDSSSSDVLKGNAVTLEKLILSNGFGCPFVQRKGEDQWSERNHKAHEKLQRLEKELADLKKRCEPLYELEKRLTAVERQIEILSTHETLEAEATPCQTKQETNETPSTLIAEPVSVEKNEELVSMKESSEEDPDHHEQYSNYVADLTLPLIRWHTMEEDKMEQQKQMTALARSLFKIPPPSPTMDESEAARRVTMCLDAIISKLKEREFFYCYLCLEIHFNYKQILIHIYSLLHMGKEYSMNPRHRNVELIKRVFDENVRQAVQAMDIEDRVQEGMRRLKYGMIESKPTMDFRPNHQAFVLPFLERYCPQIDPHSFMWEDSQKVWTLEERRIKPKTMEDLVGRTIERVKGPIGRRAMDELHHHIGKFPTACEHCGTFTGDRDEWYLHMLSAGHVSNVTKTTDFDLLTVLVNVFRRDLI